MKWTFSTKDDEIFDGEFDTRQEAEDAAQEAFNEQCDQEGWRGFHTTDAKLLEFYLNDDLERVITATTVVSLEWQYEAPEREQHFRQSDYV